MSKVTEMAESLKQWKLGTYKNSYKGEKIYPKNTFSGPRNRNYVLKGQKYRKFLQNEQQTYGMNLGWTDNAEPSTAIKVARWFFTRDGGNNDKPIAYGEVIALGNGGDPSWIRHESRTVGINLGWKSSPVFEWELVGGEKGNPVKTGDLIAIYNRSAKECMIAFDRTIGGDIGWPSSETWGEQLGDFVWDTGKKAVYSYLGI